MFAPGLRLFLWENAFKKATTIHMWSKKSSRLYSSTLYITGKSREQTSVVKVELDLRSRLSNQDELKRNLAVRKMNFDLEKLTEDFKLLQMVVAEKRKLEDEKKEIAKIMGELVKTKNVDGVTQSKEILILRGKEIKKQLKIIANDWYQLEETVMLSALKLPNDLHPDTPLDKIEVLEETGKVAEQNALTGNHISVGRKFGWIKFSNIGPQAVFLSGQLVELKQLLVNHFVMKLEDACYCELISPSIFRTVVVEACGIDFEDQKKIVMLESKTGDGHYKIENLNHLSGVSPLSFAAYLTRMCIKRSILPAKYFSVGTSFTPLNRSEDLFMGLYGTVQSEKIEVCVVCQDEDGSQKSFKEIEMMIWKFYKSLGLQARLVAIPASELTPTETSRKEIHLWAPSLGRYLKVASVSSSGTYVSQRLMITHTDNVGRKNFVHLIHGEVLDVNKLIACIVEYGTYSSDQDTFILPVLPGIDV